MTAGRSIVSALAGSLALLLGGCAVSLWPKPPPQPELFTLDAAAAALPAEAGFAGRTQATLIVAVPRAAAGYDTSRIAYQRRAQEIEYFAFARWVDAPAQMLAPLIVGALQRSGRFAAVVAAPTSAAAELRLDTELIRLQHDFGDEPSRVRLTLRAVLLDNTHRRVLATREFDLSEAAASDDPYGGVVAAQRAVQRLLTDVAGFCADSL